MNTYKLTESSQLIQTSLVFRRSRTIELSDIENIEVTEGISGIVPTKNFIMKIKTTKNEMFCIGSKLNGNYDLLSKEIMRITAQTS